MENYQLKEDEVILYRGEVELLPNWKHEKKTAFTSTSAELILTNHNIVLNSLIKKVFQKIVTTDVYAVSTIKIYQEVPQVLQKGAYVEVYLMGKELFLNFPNKKEGTNFVNSALRLLTGFSKLVRGVKKTQKAIKETEDALDVDITGTARTIAGVATDVAISVSAAGKAKKGMQALGFIANAFKNQEQMQIPKTNNVKKLKELKTLLDNGTITQEEFDKMKQEYIG